MAERGLSAAEVAHRVANGQVNDVPSAPTRTVGQILRANLLTRFNLLLGSLLAVILVVGPLQDALFGLVIVANTVVGIVQELRAKRTLDRLEVVNAPRAKVVRDGQVAELAVGQVVLDDVLEAAAGDQVVVDGEVLEAAGLEVDESLLTGESETVARRPGDRLLSGSFVAAGSGRYRATKVGREAYAVQLTEQARRFTLARSELRAGVDQILKYVTWALVPTAALLFVSQLRLEHGVRAGLSGAVAGTVAMVPEGLVLLTSVAFAVGVVRLGRRQVLVRELPAVETLARVDVICFDKTGTITAGDLAVQELVPRDGAAGEEEAAAALGALAAADPNPNATLRAIGQAFPAPGGWRPRRPSRSPRPASGAGPASPTRGSFLLGAPEVLLAPGGDGGPGDRRGGPPVGRPGRAAAPGRADRRPGPAGPAPGPLGPAVGRRGAAAGARPAGHGGDRRPGPRRRRRHRRLVRRRGGPGQGRLRRPSPHRRGRRRPGRDRRRRPPGRRPDPARGRGRAGRACWRPARCSGGSCPSRSGPWWRRWSPAATWSP